MNDDRRFQTVLFVVCLALVGCEPGDPAKSSAPPSSATSPATDVATVSPAPPIPADWQTVSAGRAFTFRAPADLKPVPVQGMDSFVGQYENDAFEVSFDYGMYSDPLTHADLAGREVIVDERRARLARKDKYVGIHFANVTEFAGLTMSVKLKSGDDQQAEAILRSIDFP